MGIYSDVLLTVDFDRTMTAPDSTIPERNMEAIRYFMDNGGAFTINTGRGLPMFRALLDVVPVNAPLLLYNGSAAYDRDKGEFAFLYPIDLDMKQTMIRAIELFPEMTVEVQGVDAHYLFKEDIAWRDFTAANNCPWEYASLDDDLGPFLKFAVYGKITDVTVAHLYGGTPEEIAEIDRAQDILEKEFGDVCSVFRPADRILDIQARGVSKGRAARDLLERMGRKILVCVGDGENDVTMLDEADFAYCPADAIIRDRYENVCDCADGAVADVIYKKIPEILR